MGDASEHFSWWELECKDGCGMRPGPQLLIPLEELRVELGAPICPTSVCRCPAHDAAVHRQRDPDYDKLLRFGTHTLGLAIDFPVLVSLWRKLMVLVHGDERWSGVGIHLRPGHWWVHLDLAPGPFRTWSY